MTQDGNVELREQVRKARGKFAAMAATYSLGVFNDNFFKQAACLMQRAVQGQVMFVFTVPYLLFSAYAGWLADRFSKKHIVVGAKVLELAAMICGAVGICTGNWHLILAMAFTMGLQSAIFGPSLNGSIPELYPASYVLKANAVLKMVVTTSILLGVALAGPALDAGSGGGEVWGIPLGQAVVAVMVLIVAACGVLLSFGVVRRPAADPGARFPKAGPANTLMHLYGLRKDALLAAAIACDCFVWSAGALIILLVNYMGGEQFRYSDTLTSTLVASELVGIAIGGMLSTRLATGSRWHRVLAPAAIAMGLCLLMMLAVPALEGTLRLAALYVLMGGMGIAGGMFMIPCESFVQVRPAPEKKGTTIAASNFAVFAGIMLSGPLADFLNARIRPTTSMAGLGVAALLVAAVLFTVIPKVQDA